MVLRRLAELAGNEPQQDIYHLLAPSLAAARSSPRLEVFRTKGVAVLTLKTYGYGL